MANPAMMFGDPTTAVGGNIVGHACLAGDSLIQLSDGRIKEIKNMDGESVMCNNNLKLSFSISEKCLVNPDVKEIYRIKTNSQIECSPLHRFFLVDNFNIVEKEAKDLKQGDFVMQAGNVYIEGSEQELPIMQTKKIVKISEESANLIKEKLENGKESREKICKKIGITKRQLRRVLNQQEPTSYNVAENLQNYFNNGLMLQLVPAQSYKHRDLLIPGFMNHSLGQIFGYFLGDGNFEARGLRFRDAREDVLIYYRDLFKEIFNIKGKISKMKDKNCFTLNINSSEIADFFKMIIPALLDYIGESKNDVVARFARGFFDAEGHINKKRAYVSASQKDRRILKYMQMFLLRLGIRSTIKFDIGRKKINVLRIIDNDVKNYLKIGFTAKDKQEILIEKIRELEEKHHYEMMPIKRYDVINLLKEQGISFSKIIKPRDKNYKWISRKELEKAFEVLMNAEIKDRQVKQKINFIFEILNSDLKFEKIRGIDVRENKGGIFYDFAVPENENYVANGFVVHNSTYRIYLRRGKKDSRVAKLIDSPNLPDNETVFMIETDGLKDVEV